MKSGNGTKGRAQKKQPSSKQSKVTKKLPPNPRGRDAEEGPRTRRRQAIHLEIKSGTYPNKNTLAKQFGVHPETIKAALDDLEAMGMPLAYDAKKKGFYYTGPVPDVPHIPVTQKELGALVTIEHLAHQMPGNEMATNLRSISRKMRRTLASQFTYTISDARKHFSIRYTAESLIPDEIMDALSRLTAGRQQFWVLYRSSEKKGEYKRRLFNPYHLTCINGEWFLFAYDDERGEVRRFAPIRMKNIVPTGVTFEIPDSFDIEKELEKSFGIQSADGIYDIILEAEASAADFIREKRWRGQTKQVELPCGGLELHLTLSSLVEIERFVLSYRGNITVLEPQELAERCLKSSEKFHCRQMIKMKERERLRSGGGCSRVDDRSHASA